MLKPAFSPRYLSQGKIPTLNYQTEQKPLSPENVFFISSWKIAGMLPNKLKNLFNLDFQLNNCCIVMEAIYQNLKDPPPYLSIGEGERPGEQCWWWQNSDQICNILSFCLRRLSNWAEKPWRQTGPGPVLETPGNLWIWTHSLQLLLTTQHIQN